jgi:hypothetical protein
LAYGSRPTEFGTHQDPQNSIRGAETPA